MIKAILFDLDGTLLNTSKDIHSVLNQSLIKFGAPQISFEQTLRYVGNGAKKLVERALGGNCISAAEQVYKDYSKNFNECDNALTTLYQGEEAALENFKNAGIGLAVITNKPQLAAERVCAQYLSKFEFQAIIGQSDKFPLKPNPAAALCLIEKFGVKKEECVFVGDGETDVATAKNAGIKCVSALWGFRSKKELENAGATIFAQCFKELEIIVEKL